jgi:hypothetical protein
LKVVSAEYQELVTKKNALEKERVKNQQELDKQTQTVQQIAEYKKKLESDILATRSAANGAEDAIRRDEKVKLKQDEVLDQLTQKVAAYQEELAYVLSFSLCLTVVLLYCVCLSVSVLLLTLSSLPLSVFFLWSSSHPFFSSLLPLFFFSFTASTHNNTKHKQKKMKVLQKH